MKPKYFCAHHASKLTASEQYAIGSWTELMRRGTQAYAESRMEAAWIYLGAAIEVSLLRSSLSNNDTFSDMHLAKPLEFLIKGCLATAEINRAAALLSKIATAIDAGSLAPGEALADQIEQHYAQVKAEEKQCVNHYHHNLEDLNETTYRATSSHLH